MEDRIILQIWGIFVLKNFVFFFPLQSKKAKNEKVDAGSISVAIFSKSNQSVM